MMLSNTFRKLSKACIATQLGNVQQNLQWLAVQQEVRESVAKVSPSWEQQLRELLKS